MNLAKEKVVQSIQILDELDIDLWLIFCRESEVTPDPSIPLVVGHNVVGRSAFMISKEGETIAILSGFDASDFIASGVYQEVITYKKDVSVEILKVLNKLDPKTIAINYSTTNVTADGLTHGMYLLLKEYLADTPYQNRLISAEEVLYRVRGRKNEREIQWLKEAVEIANQSWQQSLEEISVGMSEIQIAEILTRNLKKRHSDCSFAPIINAGAKTTPGHGSPTDAILEKGDLLHVDFGALVNGYCSDIQRLVYFKRDGEETAPPDLQKAFQKIKTIIEVTAKAYKTGAIGHEIDTIARKMLTEDGYPEYDHCLGHQIGQYVHDGSALVGPQWKRYGQVTSTPLERNNAFTVELGIEIEEIGYVGLEEDLVVTDSGGVFLGQTQTELIVK